MKTWVGTPRRTGRRSRRFTPAVFAALVVASVLSLVGATPPTAAAQAADDGAAFSVVGRVPLFDGTPEPPAHHDNDGWLVINPGTRRGYQVFRPTPNDTMISSFHLDTLEH